MSFEWAAVGALGVISLVVAVLGAVTAMTIARRGQQQITEIVSAGHRQAVLLAREEEREDAYRSALEYASAVRLEFDKVARGEHDDFVPPDIGGAAPVLAGVSAHGGPGAAHLYSEFLMQVPTVNHYASRLVRVPRDEERRESFRTEQLTLERLYETFAAHAHDDLATPLPMPSSRHQTPRKQTRREQTPGQHAPQHHQPAAS